MLFQLPNEDTRNHSQIKSCLHAAYNLVMAACTQPIISALSQWGKPGAMRTSKEQRGSWGAFLQMTVESSPQGMTGGYPIKTTGRGTPGRGNGLNRYTKYERCSYIQYNSIQSHYRVGKVKTGYILHDLINILYFLSIQWKAIEGF